MDAEEVYCVHPEMTSEQHTLMRRLLTVSNIIYLIAAVICMIRHNFLLAMLLTAVAAISTIYHGTHETCLRWLDVSLALISGVVVMGLSLLYGGVVTSMASSVLLVAAIFFFTDTHTGCGHLHCEYVDPTFMMSHAMWHIVSGAAVCVAVMGMSNIPIFV